ncbi:unnamed protein product, partial [Urochloa humidicola]
DTVNLRHVIFFLFSRWASSCYLLHVSPSCHSYTGHARPIELRPSRFNSPHPETLEPLHYHLHTSSPELKPPLGWNFTSRARPSSPAAPPVLDTLRLPEHVREQVLRSHRLRHATSLINISDMSSEGSSRGGRRLGRGGSFGNGGGGGGSSHGGRRWQSFLARTVSWARVGGDGSVRKGWDGGSTRRGRDDGESITLARMSRRNDQRLPAATALARVLI